MTLSAISPIRRRLTLAAVVLVLVAAVIGGVSITQANAQAQAQAATQLLTQRTAQAASDDETFFAQVERDAAQFRAQAYQTDLAAAREQRDTQLVSAREAHTASEGKVLDDTVRATLTTAIQAAEQAQHPAGITAALPGVEAAVDPVREAVTQWQAEQERAAAAAAEAAERARQEAAAERAAQQRRPATAQQASTSQERASVQAPEQARPAAEQQAPTAGGGSYRDRVAGVLARHGCGSAGIIIDDPRLAGFNGRADWFNNTILVRSGMGGRLDYIVAHECVHLMQYRIYGGDLGALERDMNAIYGGSGQRGLEQNADCVTQRWGYSASNYTSSCGGARGDAAAAIASGRRP